MKRLLVVVLLVIGIGVVARARRAREAVGKTREAVPARGREAAERLRGRVRPARGESTFAAGGMARAPAAEPGDGSPPTPPDTGGGGAL